MSQLTTSGWSWTVARLPAYVTAESELYDLAADPYELQNETNNPAYASTKATLAARLRELRPDWSP